MTRTDMEPPWQILGWSIENPGTARHLIVARDNRCHAVTRTLDTNGHGASTVACSRCTKLEARYRVTP